MIVTLELSHVVLISCSSTHNVTMLWYHLAGGGGGGWGLLAQLGLLQQQLVVGFLESLLYGRHGVVAGQSGRLSGFSLLPVELLQPLVPALRLLPLGPLLLSLPPLPLLLLPADVLPHRVGIVVPLLVSGVGCFWLPWGGAGAAAASRGPTCCWGPTPGRDLSPGPGPWPPSASPPTAASPRPLPGPVLPLSCLVLQLQVVQDALDVGGQQVCAHARWGLVSVCRRGAGCGCGLTLGLLPKSTSRPFGAAGARPWLGLRTGVWAGALMRSWRTFKGHMLQLATRTQLINRCKHTHVNMVFTVTEQGLERQVGKHWNVKAAATWRLSG